MRVNPKEFDSFYKNLPKNVKSILLYGADYGAVQENLEKLKCSFLGKNYDNLALSNLVFSEVKDKLEMVYEEINNYNFFTSKKLIVISEASANIDENLKKLINSVPENNLIIFVAKELPVNSSLRKFFEIDKDIFSLPIYQDEERNLKHLAAEILKEKNFTWDEKFLDYFVKYNKVNKLLFIKELEKIISFLGENKHIKLEEIVDIIGKNEDHNLEDHWLNLFSGRELLDIEKNIYICAEFNMIAILRSLNNFVFKLIELLEINDQTKDFKETSKTISPPIFFKKIPQYELVVKKISMSSLTEIITEIRSFEIMIKSYGEMAKPLIFRFLSDLSRKFSNEV